MDGSTGLPQKRRLALLVASLMTGPAWEVSREVSRERSREGSREVSRERSREGSREVNREGNSLPQQPSSPLKTLQSFYQTAVAHLCTLILCLYK